MTNWVRLLFLLAVVLLPQTTLAYSTRLHIVFANRVREAILEGDGSVVLLGTSGTAVQLRDEDVEAIRDYPTAFRAGSIGPDNFVFPALTDGTHGVEQDPFRQCELLYEDAVTGEERAYALGCFAHGTADVVAHHLVNFFTGETFTLNPTADGRVETFSNVVGHIVTESVIQEAIFDEDPTAFNAGNLALDLPRGFISRNYHNPEAPLYQLMTRHVRERLETARRSQPNATLFEVAQSEELAPWEHLAMAPLYLAEVDAQRATLRNTILTELADLQDPRTTRGRRLGVTAGADGRVGTSDDRTACTTACADLYVRYVTLVNLLSPRRDAGGRPLPSAFDKVSEKLSDDLKLFLPALLDTIENMSASLNAPLVPGDDHGFPLTEADAQIAMQPLRNWAQTTSRIDYETLSRSVVPEWYSNLSAHFNTLGIDIRPSEILRVFYQPIVDQVRLAIETLVIAESLTYLQRFIHTYEETRHQWEAGVAAVLRASKPLGSDAHAFNRPSHAGFYLSSFNLIAVTLANHEVMLTPEGSDPVEHGPASFDASYTHTWSQAALCPYLEPLVFPLGTSVGSYLSLLENGSALPSMLMVNSPIECHSGSIRMFGDANEQSCSHVTLPQLLSNPIGSTSRSFPPLAITNSVACRNIVVPGIELTMAEQDAGLVTPRDGATQMPTSTTGGCACSTSPTAPNPMPFSLLLALFLIRVLGSRKRRQPALLLATLAACSPAPASPEDSGQIVVDASVDSNTDANRTDSAQRDAATEDSGADHRPELINALRDTVWHANQTRYVGNQAVERAYEVRFDLASFQWGEIQNPFGPSRERTLRSFTINRDGRRVDSIILSPAGWPIHERNGARESWTFRIVEGNPRKLIIADDWVEEEFTEGAYPRPTSGLTAEVRVFGPSGRIHSAFCSAGPSLDDEERRTMWDFARGRSLEPSLGYDVVAGARLLEWLDSRVGANDFSITDIDGFSRLGGTHLSDQFNFVARFSGSIAHSGGDFSIRESDDQLEDVVWAFAGSRVDSTNPNDLMLEVHNWANADRTPDVGTYSLPQGAVDVEIMLVRCGMPFNTYTARVELNLGHAGWQLVGLLPSTPKFSTELFPPAL